MRMFSKKHEIVPVKYKKLYTIYVAQVLGRDSFASRLAPTKPCADLVGASLLAKR
jgi:hypothetical protein